MADVNILNNGAASGGLMGVLAVTCKWLYESWQSHKGSGYATREDLKETVVNMETNAKQKAQDLEMKTLKIAEEIKEKADTQDIKIALLEHQKSCISEMRADTKSFQSEILLSFSRMQEANQESFRRVHERIDGLKDELSRERKY